jgi:sugar-phosphatase
VILTCSGILFDLDGVLVDSTGAVARVWRTWAGRYGLDAERVIREAHGRRSIESIRALAPQLDAERENEIVEAMEIADQDGVVALPGAAQLLRELPRAQHAIVTSATRALAVARMGHAGLPIPQYFVSADDVSEGKPSPRPYLQAAALLKLEPQECLVFEDAPAGVESARRAGMCVIGLTTTFSAKDLRAADAIVASLAEVRAEIASGVIRLKIDGPP